MHQDSQKKRKLPWFTNIIETMKRLSLIIPLLTICFSGFNQDNDTIKANIINIEWLVFKTNDTIYHFSKFIKPDGKFYFQHEFYTLENVKSSRVWEFDKRGNITDIFDNVINLNINSIDTIISYFPFKLEPDIYQHGIPYELIGSNILQKLGGKVLFNYDYDYIRILYPCDDLNDYNFYELFEIDFSDETALIHRTTGISKDYNGMQIIQRDSARMKEQDVKRIKKLFKKISEMESQECREPGNPWILEYNIDGEYKRFIISHYCASWKRELKPLVLFVSGIVGPSRNYFGMWCSH